MAKSRAAAIIIGGALAAAVSGATADSLNQRREQVAAYFKSDEEPSALDAHWTQPDIFKVGMLDTGAPRDGYAVYVCEVLADKGFRGRRVQVQIIDITALIREDKWRTIGKATCQ